jgi:hypothetical protein
MKRQQTMKGPLLHRAPGLVALALAAALLAGCGSPASHPSGSALQPVCQEVMAVLSDGPDPGADPVGYAEAQILPLRQVHTADADLRTAIDNLASAYAQFYRTNGTHAALQVVNQASKQVNAICPGATS